MQASLLSTRVGGGLIALILLTWVFWRIEKRAADPIVRPALFESAQITKSCIISTGVSAVQMGSIFIPALLLLGLIAMLQRGRMSRTEEATA